MKGRKKLMITALQKTLGVVSAAAEQVGISRQLHYDWIKKDPEYKQAADDLPEFVLDFAEHSLFTLIKEKNVAATIFYLKTKGKHRGYIEKSEIEHFDRALTIEEHTYDGKDKDTLNPKAKTSP